MKKILILLVALFQLLMVPGALAASRQTVLVNNVEELMEALGDHREIILAPGRYNLSAWIGSPSAKRTVHLFGYNPLSPPGLYLAYDVLELAGFQDLTIRGQDTGDITAEIVTEDPYTAVLHFRNCENLRLAHLRIGHFLKKGYCSGAVLNLDSVKNISLEHLDLYGCGTYGYEARNSENITLSDSVIRNCTYGLVDAVGCRDLKIVRTVFKDTSTNLPLFALAHSRLELRDCTFHNVYGKMEDLSVTGGSAE
ncbi:right-handed parallel beta-helix repeat-containing protein [Acidaminococcus massiliensis]|jgi:hypothetical protein|uniref:right-handed parallel beta-helix repeat-containing protein n=1 Tax=Acidaminococcus massiliensis TaxID=1852375 RepID=UPI0023F0422F|nr:right-handed parallel beta-helix repeat-containing protein [Acidaminococcus massiliensis]